MEVRIKEKKEVVRVSKEERMWVLSLRVRKKG